MTPLEAFTYGCVLYLDELLDPEDFEEISDDPGCDTTVSTVL